MVDPLNRAAPLAPRPAGTYGVQASAPSPGAPLIDQLQARPARAPGTGTDASADSALDALSLPTVGESFAGITLEADPAAILGLVDDGYAHLGIGFRPGADMGLIRVPERRDGGTRPAIYANTSVLIEDGRWVTDGERARAGSALGERDQGWLRETSASPRNRERTLVYLSDENGSPAELDGPLWFDPDRVYLTDDGRILADVPCLPDSWFDFTEELTGQKRIDPNDPAGLARAFMPEPFRFGESNEVNRESSEQVDAIVNALAEDSFRIFGAGGTLQAGRLRIGSGNGTNDGIFLNVSSGSTVQVDGDLGNLTTVLDVNFSSFNLVSNGSSVNTGDGSAQITINTQFYQDPQTGEYDFSRSPEISISVAGLSANDTQLNMVAPEGGTQTFRVGRLEASGTGAPEITIQNGVTGIDLDDVDLYDLRGGIRLPGQSTPIRLGGGDARGQGVTLEDVRFRYDSVSQVVELSGMTSSRPNPAAPAPATEPAFAVRVGSWEIIDGDLADVELDITLGEGAIDIPNGSEFTYRSNGVDFDPRRIAERQIQLEQAAARQGVELDPEVIPFLAERLLPGFEDQRSGADTIIRRLGASGASDLAAIEHELDDLLLPRASFSIEAPENERWRFSGNLEELKLGRSAADIESEPENRLSSMLNQVSADFSSETRGDIHGHALRWTEGELPELEDVELQLAAVVDELGIPVGIGDPIRFFGGTGGNLNLTLNRAAGEPFFDGSGTFDLVLGGEARQQARGIQGLQDADVLISADAGGATLNGNIVLGAEGTVDLTTELDARDLGIDIRMLQGEPPESDEPISVERRDTDLPPHVPIHIREPVAARTRTGQSPVQLEASDISEAVRAFVDDGRLSLSVPTEGVGTGRFSLDFTEEQLWGWDTVGFSINARDVRAGDGSLDFDLTFSGEGDMSQVDVQRSQVTLTHPLEFDFDVIRHRQGLHLINEVPVQVTGRVTEIDIVDAGDGRFTLKPNIEFDDIDVFGVLPVGFVADIDFVRNAINEAIGSRLLAEPLFGQGSLPRSRDELLDALFDGGVGQSLNFGIEGAAPRTSPEVTPILTPQEMRDAAFDEIEGDPIDVEAALMELALERTSGLPAQDRQNVLTALRQFNRLFDVNGTTLTVRDDDGEGGIQLADRRLDLGDGQHIDFAPGTELEIDITAAGGLVLRGNANLDSLRIGQPGDGADNPGDDFHLDLRDLSTQIELQVVPVEGQDAITAISLVNTSGTAQALNALIEDGELQVEGSSIALSDDAEPGALQNVIAARFGGGQPPTARFYLPDISGGTMSYRTDMNRLRPNWDDSLLDIQVAQIESASLRFDGRSLSTIAPLRVSAMDAVVSNLVEDLDSEQTVSMKRASITGSAELALLPGGNIGIYGGADGAEPLRFQAISNPFDLVTNGPRIEAPIAEDGWLAGNLVTMRFGPEFGTRIEVVDGEFSGETGAGRVFIGPDDTQVETLEFSDGRIEGGIRRLTFDGGAEGEAPTFSVHLTYDIDGTFNKDIPLRELDVEALAARGIELALGAEFDGRFRLTGEALVGPDGFRNESRTHITLTAEAQLRAAGIDAASNIREAASWIVNISEMEAPQ